MTDVRKPWHAYACDYRGALTKAYLDGFDAHFPTHTLAQSYKVRMQHMAADILRQPDAPADLRDAAARVAWGLPAITASGWTVRGAVRVDRVKVTDAELIAHLREGEQ